MNEHRRYYNYLLTFLDALIIAGSYVIAWYLRFRTPLFRQDEWVLARYIYMRELLVIIPGFLVFYYLFHVYSQVKLQRKRTIFIHLTLTVRCRCSLQSCVKSTGNPSLSFHTFLFPMTIRQILRYLTKRADSI